VGCREGFREVVGGGLADLSVYIVSPFLARLHGYCSHDSLRTLYCDETRDCT
jgi:hypothetical protein